MTTIEVRIAPKDLHQQVPGVASVFAMQKCREAGIPVRGIFTFEGVAHGTLMLDRDMKTGDYVYLWEPECRYTLAEIEAAFRAQFHKAGEVWFPYADEESAEEATRDAWSEFADALSKTEG
ncbi:hypothetical protein SAMD00023378_3958 [Ralstonia sp. NT80]|uniref:hypothetical protein n=1 Tax=Ralstonia sp. NT80 TaxID=1218247 RepID=UPI00066A6484|nr:hypothetical protein [Ralstonia sp. NT80]GAQ30275.1 hypothetical protein SAMD00023378_3958 [Ralstonia sp. NT80]